MAQWTPVGQGNVDIGRIVEILAEHVPAVPVNLEIITAGVPRHIPYLNPDAEFWKLYPDLPARDFARFIALAQRGTPGPLDQHTAPPGTRDLPPGAPGEPLRAQQRRHLEESVGYCRDVLGLGERGR